MPYVQIVTSKKMDSKQKEQVKAQLGKSIDVIPGKSEEVLMIGFNDGTDMYFQGAHKDNTAFVEVNLHGDAEEEQKSILINDICRIMDDAIGVPKEDLFISIPTYKYWGFQGRLV